MTKRPWPLIGSIAIAIIFINLIKRFIEIKFFNRIIIAFILIIFNLIVWWRDIKREAESGQHNLTTHIGIKIRILLIITSEVLFFFSFFWRYFWYRNQIILNTGIKFPPIGVTTINPYTIPFLNRFTLLSSGVSVTWAHHIVNKNHKRVYIGLITTVILGLIFTLLQIYEFSNIFFSIEDSIYGSIFFTVTTFHGIHVIVGSIILLVSIIRLKKGIINKIRHNNIEIAIWYWHFVDVVWLILYIWVYWWI